MGWKLNARAPICFLCSFMVKGVIFESDVICRDNNQPAVSMRELSPGGFREVDQQVEKLIKRYAGHCILDANFKSFIASDVACAIVFCARQQVGCEEPWDPKLLTHTGLRENPYESEEVRDIIRMLCKADLTTNASSITLPPRRERDTGVNEGMQEEDKANEMHVVHDQSSSSKENLRPEINV